MKAGTLFSGIGGADVGLQQAGFDIAWAIERDPIAAGIYQQNFGHSPIVKDICQIDPRDLPPVDLLWASPPCQQFSTARAKNLPRHEGADLGFEVVRFLKALQPRYFILENVPGYKNATSFKAIVEVLNELGYWSNWQIVNAADFGVPQFRKRLILRSVKHGWLPEVPLAQPHNGWYEAIADLVPELPETELAPWQLRALRYKVIPLPAVVSPTDLNASSKRYKTRTEEFYSITPSTANSCRLLLPRVGTRNIAKGLRQIPAESPAPTVRALGHDRHWRQFDAIVDRRVLKVTPRCFARLQSFPDSFWLPDDPVAATKGIGNAVPCELARAIVEGLS